MVGARAGRRNGVINDQRRFAIEHIYFEGYLNLLSLIDDPSFGVVPLSRLRSLRQAQPLVHPVPPGQRTFVAFAALLLNSAFLC